MRKILIFLLISFSLHALSLTENGKLKTSAQELLILFEIPQDLDHQQLSAFLLQQWMQAKKERWEMDERFESLSDRAFPLLQQLGCIDTIHAQKKHYNYALALGATGPVMKKRLDFLYEEWQRGVRFDQIILLTGERDLDPKMETYSEELKTETDLFVYLFEQHPLKVQVPCTIIDSPKQLLDDGTLRRPTTASTISEWLLTDPKPGSCLAASTQPFVGYQEAVLKLLLPTSFEVEAIGPQINQKYPLSIYLDNFAKWFKHEQERLNEESASENLSY